jgi:hypothetical protein
MLSPADQIAQLEHCIRTQMQEIDRLRALTTQKDAELDALVGWIAGDEDALGALRAIYADPRQNPANKIKAASAAIGFERSKPASQTNVAFSLWNCLETNRLAELDQKAKVIEAKPLQQGQSILASDHEGGAAMGPEADPAA